MTMDGPPLVVKIVCGETGGVGYQYMICGNMAGLGAIGAKPCGNGAAGIGCGICVIWKFAASDDWENAAGLAVGIKVGPEIQVII